jgi:hypothetical protein
MKLFVNSPSDSAYKVSQSNVVNSVPQKALAVCKAMPASPEPQRGEDHGLCRGFYELLRFCHER